MVTSFLLAMVLFSAYPARGFSDNWYPGDNLGYGSKRMFEWLATKLEREYVIGTYTKAPPFKGKTPDVVYFHGNGTCELVDLESGRRAKVVITRGTWKIVDDKLEMVLTSLEMYGEGSVDGLVPPVIETFEFADWQDTRFQVHVPTERMFEGIATELKREYLIGVWSDEPFVAGYSAPIVLTLEENGAYELFYLEGTNLLETSEVCTTIEWGTWAIVDNKLELTQTSHGDYEFIEERDPPVVDSYEITGLQYVFDIPKEYNGDSDIAVNVAAFVQSGGLMWLGEQLTMHIGETQLWN